MLPGTREIREACGGYVQLRPPNAYLIDFISKNDSFGSEQDLAILVLSRPSVG